jgi:Protein of unknown function (DUF742)
VSPPDSQWFDQDAGPVVRPYALTGGRTRPTGETIDLLALICAIRGVAPDLLQLEPEQILALRACRVPTPVADLAADLDLPLGVIRILVSDLRERGLVTIHEPAPARLADRQILKDVADALRRI